jgi:hypothetical protein
MISSPILHQHDSLSFVVARAVPREHIATGSNPMTATERGEEWPSEPQGGQALGGEPGRAPLALRSDLVGPERRSGNMSACSEPPW